MVVDAFDDFTLRTLTASGVASMALERYVHPDAGLEGMVEGAAILLAVAVCVAVAAGNNYQKEVQFRELSAVASDVSVRVVRSGEPRDVSCFDVVPGDVLLVEAGDILCADGVLVAGSEVRVDESHLTGESEDVAKDAIAAPVMLSGSRVMGGTGRVLVLAVGERSQQGLVERLVRGDGGLVAEGEGVGGAGGGSRLQESLEKLAGQIGAAGTGAAAFVFLSLASRAVAAGVDAGAPLLGFEVLSEVVNAFVVAITVLVVAIPEGLPLAVTIALAYSVKRMLADSNLVRHLDACETMGCATTICSDKTGTLTTNRQTVVRLWTLLGEHPVPVSLSKPLPQDMDPISGQRPTPGAGGGGEVPGLRFNRPLGGGGASPPVPLDRYPLVPALLDLSLSSSLQDGAAWAGTVAARNFGADVAGSRVGGLGVDQLAVDIYSQAVMLNSTAVVGFDVAEGRRKFKGTRTEIALLKLARGDGWDFDELRSRHTELRVMPFSSARKRMTTVVSGEVLARGGERVGDPTKAAVLCKGAAEIVLARCESALGPGGEVVKLTEEMRGRLLEQSCRSHLRVLAVAYKVVPSAGVEAAGEDELESGLTLVALAGIEDPVRPEVPAAIKKCQGAGITLRMLTGDNAITATNIARQCGIISASDMAAVGEGSGGGDAGNIATHANHAVTPGQVRALQAGGTVVEGSDFRSRVLREDGTVDWAAFENLWGSMRVMARCSPQDKYLLVTCVRALSDKVAGGAAGGAGPPSRLREVVAVTGDGTNDAPALRAADVGFGMNSGTEIAKNASDIVLLDDNFTSIVSATKWGRNVFSGVRKFLQFQLTVNVTAILTASVSAVFLSTSPLSSVQMLWVNLIMDSLASLALATDEPSDELLERPPFRPDDPMVTPEIAKSILGQAAYQLAVMYALVFHAPAVLGVAPDAVGSAGHWTVVFNAFVLMQLGNQLNCQMSGARDLESAMRALVQNRAFMLVVGSELALQALLVQFGGAWAQTEALGGPAWGACAGFGALSLVVGAALRPLRAPEWMRFG